MTDPIEELIKKITNTIDRLKNWISDSDRDELEFDINDFNINISWMEYDYDCRVLRLDKKKDEEYQKEKENIKTDAAMKRYLESKFIEDQQKLDKTSSEIKRYKRLHSWFIRIAEHIKSNVIKEQADMKRNWF